MRLPPFPLLAVALVLAWAAPAAAAVIDAQPTGFTVVETVDIAATQAHVWAALARVDAWWSSDHTFSHDARNLKLELKPGSCWCETLPGGGGVAHMIVVYVQPLRTVRFFGALGPLQGLGAAGAMTWTLKEAAGRTTVTWTYDIGGHAPGGLAALADPVDHVLGDQARRLKAYVETGKP